MNNITEVISAINRGVREFHESPCTIVVGPRGGEVENIVRWRVSGQIKRWKTRPEEFRVPIKYGLYQNHYLDHNNCTHFHPADECKPKKLHPHRPTQEGTRRTS